MTAIEAKLATNPGGQAASELLQLGVFRLGLLEQGEIRISIFQQRKKILIGSSGGCGVAAQSTGSGQAEMSEC
jgi:hypothetical protein